MSEPVRSGARPDTGSGSAATTDRRGSIGWGRAVLSGLAIIVIGFVGVVLVPYKVVTLDAPSRDSRALIAAAVALVVVFGMAWSLRRLQARGVI